MGVFVGLADESKAFVAHFQDVAALLRGEDDGVRRNLGGNGVVYFIAGLIINQV
jgi:hypothetical protein